MKFCRPFNNDIQGHYRCDENGDKVCYPGKLMGIRNVCESIHNICEGTTLNCISEMDVDIP